MKKNFIAGLMAAFVVCALFVFSGCGTPPPAGPVGFPLIDIVDAEVTIADDSRFAIEGTEWTRSANTRVIGGVLNSKIVPKDITIDLVETSFQAPIKNREDLRTWFRNIPDGLTATAHALDPEAKYAAEKGATRIIVTIEGTPTKTINQPILIRVPADKLNRSWDFDIPPDEDRRFEVYGVSIAEIVVNGAVSRPIDSKTFEIRFGQGTRLTETIPLDTDVSDWFSNLPGGLSAVIAEEAVPVTEEGRQQSLMIRISGVPTRQVNEKMRISIPADITTANMVLEVPPSDRVKYDIGPYSSIPVTDLASGSNWKGAQQGWGLTGPEVFKSKDFTAVGIIQLKATSVYAMGDDGEEHWTGDYITYGDLMAEAQRLNAHAIIDVVIDSDDKVDVTVERRWVGPSHTPTPLEEIKLRQGLIKEEYDAYNKLAYYEETKKVTNRTWTGTALAVQYAPAYAPAVGDGSFTGYLPSMPFPWGNVYPDDTKK
jgi:hypothetical protein